MCCLAVNKRVRGEEKAPRGLRAPQQFFQRQRPDVANTVRNSPFRTGRAGCSDCSAPASSSPPPGLERGQPAAAIAARRRLLRKSRPPNPSNTQATFHNTSVRPPHHSGYRRNTSVRPPNLSRTSETSSVRSPYLSRISETSSKKPAVCQPSKHASQLPQLDSRGPPMNPSSITGREQRYPSSRH